MVYLGAGSSVWMYSTLLLRYWDVLTLTSIPMKDVYARQKSRRNLGDRNCLTLSPLSSQVNLNGRTFTLVPSAREKTATRRTAARARSHRTTAATVDARREGVRDEVIIISPDMIPLHGKESGCCCGPLLWIPSTINCTAATMAVVASAYYYNDCRDIRYDSRLHSSSI